MSEGDRELRKKRVLAISIVLLLLIASEIDLSISLATKSYKNPDFSSTTTAPNQGLKSLIKDSTMKTKYPEDFFSIESLGRNLKSMSIQDIKSELLKIESKFDLEVDKAQKSLDLLDYSLQLGSIEFTPQPGITPNLAKKLNKESHGNLVCVLQFKYPLSIHEFIPLLDFSFRPFFSINELSIVGSIPSDQIDDLYGLNYVRFICEYDSSFKVNSIDLVAIARMNLSSTVKAFIWPLEVASPLHIRELSMIGCKSITYDRVADVYVAQISPKDFASIAVLSWVQSVELEKEIGFQDSGVGFEPGDSRELINAPYVWASYTGSDVRVGILDTGIWSSHPDFSGAIAYQYDQNTGTTGSAPDDEAFPIGGHGTHVAGIIASRGSRDIEGINDGKGVAPGAMLYVVKGGPYYESGIYGYDLNDAFSRFGAEEVHIASNSWGTKIDVPGVPSEDDPWNFGYDSAARIADAYVDNNMLTVVFSAGNEGPSSYSITEPGTAKNVITVGAITYTVEGVTGLGTVPDYSSRGPTLDDGRLKPEVVAPGGGGNSWTYGVVSDNAWDGSDWLDEDVSVYRWPTDEYYTRKSGTSQAAPHVSGVVALLYDAYGDAFSGDDGLCPRDIKSLLVANANPLKGYGSDFQNGFANNDTGYGLMDALYSVFDVPGEKETLCWVHGGLVNTIGDDSVSWTETVPANVKELVVTLAYEDQEGETSETQALWDDLDVRLTSPTGVEYTFTLPEGITSESPLEKIVIKNPDSGAIESGTWTFTVLAETWHDWWNPLASQRFTVLALLKYVEPALLLSVPSPISVGAGESFTISPTLSNIGGLTAAGVTAEIAGPTSFSGEINTRKFVGNLVQQGATKTASFQLVAPSTTGTYYLTVSGNGINHDLDEPDSILVEIRVGVPPDALVVPDNYPSIQAAVNAADPGDWIMVRNGTYHEWVTVNQSVTIFSEYKYGAIIDGLNARKMIFNVTVPNVSVLNFTIKNSGTDSPFNNAGVYLKNVSNCTVEGNMFVHNLCGVWAVSSSNLTVSENDIAASHLVNSRGILFQSTENSTVAKNAVQQCIVGIYVSSGSTYNNVTENILFRNGFDSGTSRTGSNIAVTDYGTRYNRIIANNITESYYAGVSNSISDSNVFFHNNFVNNYVQARGFPSDPRPNSWDDGYPSGGNYWSDYAGVDANQDDIGDSPYVVDISNIDHFPLMQPFPVLSYVAAFDFGTSGSLVKAGYNQISPSTVYSPLSGYGWGDATVLDSRDRGSADRLRRDFVFSSTERVFNVDLENGEYLITTTIGDQSFTHDQINVYAEGRLVINHLTVLGGSFQESTFRVAITDRQLELRVQDDGGADPNWILNALTIEVAPPLPTEALFDFGTSDSPVEAGYTRVSSATVYSAYAGYGWGSPVDLNSRDRSMPDYLGRDFVFSSAENTFNVDVTNGDYMVTVVIGDQNFSHDKIDVYAETVLKINDLTAFPGAFQQVSFKVTVEDSQFNLRIQDDGGEDANWVLNALSIVAALPLPTEAAFDFGASESPVEPDYTQVTSSTAYSSSLGFGWSSTAGLDSRDRSSPDALRKDFVFGSSDHTFYVDLANGEYLVTVVIGDQSYMHDLIDVYAEGVLLVNDVTVFAGAFQGVSFSVAVADEQLNLRIVDDGGADVNWVLNALTVEVAPPLPTDASFDFGTSGSPVEAGYTQVSPLTVYSAAVGFGWSSTAGLDSRDRVNPNALRSDFVFSSTEHTFNVDLANGDYQVTVVIGDEGFMHDLVDVYAEGSLKINDLTVTAGSFQELSFTVTIADGQLNLVILDNGGVDPNWVLNAIAVHSV